MLPEKDAQKLNSLGHILIRRIKLEDGALLRELRSRGVITGEQVQEIQKIRRDVRQVRKLLDFLSHGDGAALDKFVSALRASGFDELAKEFFEDEDRTSAGTKDVLPTPQPATVAQVWPIPSVRPKVNHPEANLETSVISETSISVSGTTSTEEMTQPVPSTSVSGTTSAAEMTQPVPSTSESGTTSAAKMTQPVPSTSESGTTSAAEMTQPVPSTSVSGTTSAEEMTQPVPSTLESGTTSVQEMTQPVPSTSESGTTSAAEMTQPVPSTSESGTTSAEEMTQPVPSTSESGTTSAEEMTRPVPSTSESGTTSAEEMTQPVPSTSESGTTSAEEMTRPVPSTSESGTTSVQEMTQPVPGTSESGTTSAEEMTRPVPSTLESGTTSAAEMTQPLPGTSESGTTSAAEMTQPVPSTLESGTTSAAEMTQPVPSTSVSGTPSAAEMTQPVPGTPVNGTPCSIQRMSASEDLQGRSETGHTSPVKEEPALEEDMPKSGAHRDERGTLMSQGDKDLLERKRVHLQANIRLEDGLLLAHIRARGAISGRQEEIIKLQEGRWSQVGHLLDLLQRGDCNRMDWFIYSLQATGQSHVVAKWLRPAQQLDNLDQPDARQFGGTCSTSLLSGADEHMLERARPRLMTNLDLSDGYLLGQLRARDVLRQSDEELIKSLQERKGRYHAVGQLVDLLLCKPPEALEQFLHALTLSDPSVASHLRPPTTQDTFSATLEKRGGPPVELQEALKCTLGDRLDEWKTALEEGVSGQEGLLTYINQPCSLKTKVSGRQSVNNTIELVENSRQGDRLVIYGEAGMGKTTLLKQLTRSWIEGSNSKLVDKFTYVFLIPLRLVGKISLLNIICDELDLIPVSNLKNLRETLDRNERKALFLLDSFEELRRDVARAKKTEIDDLITGRLFPKSTVVVTSRPGSGLREEENQKTAQLKDLPVKEVEKIIQQHFVENKTAVDKVQRSFPAIDFLRKPINLALFIFIITQNKHLTLAYTQAELFSLVLQYIMLAFAKKKKMEEFTPQSCSYIENKGIPRDIRRLFRDIAKKCYEERKTDHVKLHIEDADDLKEYLDFGLFTAGTGPNTVLLPHRLFLEYFAAAHLAGNPDVWTALFGEIKKESERHSPRPSLPDVVRPMGLENILRFLIALSPQPQLGNVCLQVGSLFVVEREKITDCDNYCLAKCGYYQELIRDCIDESGKRTLATALLNAPVGDLADRDKEEDKSHALLPYLDYKQRVTFLKKVHKLDLWVKDGKSILSGTDDRDKLGIGDKFAVALVYWYGCFIKADELYIRGELNRILHLPASVFTRMSGVRQLKLECCTLCDGLPDYMSDIDRSATSQQSSPCPTNSSLERVVLQEVKGLEHCDVITPCQCQLVLVGCGDVRANALKTWFPRVSELQLDEELQSDIAVTYETEEELTSWLSTIKTVIRLRLAHQRERKSLSLSHLLSILAEREDVLRLELHQRYTPMLNTSATIKQNDTLTELELIEFEGDIDLGQLLETCSHQCPQLEMVFMDGCQLRANVRDTSDTVQQSRELIELWLWKCTKDRPIDLNQLLGVCGRQCPQLELVNVDMSNLVFDNEKVESVKQLPGLQTFTLSGSTVQTPGGQNVGEEELKQHLHRLCPSAEIEVEILAEA